MNSPQGGGEQLKLHSRGHFTTSVQAMKKKEQEEGEEKLGRDPAAMHHNRYEAETRKFSLIYECNLTRLPPRAPADAFHRRRDVYDLISWLGSYEQSLALSFRFQGNN